MLAWPLAQQTVELQEFAALSFPAHPHTLGSVPPATAGNKDEPFFLCRCIACVERPDSTQHGCHERFVSVGMLLRRVYKVGEEPEVKVLVWIRQIVHLQALNEISGALWSAEHAG